MSIKGENIYRDLIRCIIVSVSNWYISFVLGTILFLWVSSIVFQGFNFDIQLAYVEKAFEPGINMFIFAILAGCWMAIFTIAVFFTEYPIYLLSLHAMGVSSLIFSVEMQYFPLLMPHDAQIIPCYGLLLGLFASFYAYDKIVDILGLYYVEKENPYDFNFQEENKE